MKVEINFQAAAWARATVHSLDIDGSLFGNSHVFDHDGRRVSIRIPEVELDDRLRTIGRSEQVATLSSWRTDNAQLETSTYHLSELDITIELPERLSAPAAIFETPPKRPDLVSKERAEQFDSLAYEYHDRLAAAFEYWQQVVRWITSSNRLGCSDLIMLSHSDEIGLPRLLRIDDGRTFWLPGGYGAAMGGTKLTDGLWRGISRVLARGLSAPLWFKYLDEAYRNGVGRDHSGTILSCAIACETLAREALWWASGATKSEDARELLGRVPVRSILGRWSNLTAIPKTSSRIKDVAELFTLRNRLMHVGGRGDRLDDDRVRHFFQAARAFVWTGDEWYFQTRGEDNPRLSRSPEDDRHLWPHTTREYHSRKK